MTRLREHHRAYDGVVTPTGEAARISMTERIAKKTGAGGLLMRAYAGGRPSCLRASADATCTKTGCVVILPKRSGAADLIRCHRVI